MRKKDDSMSDPSKLTTIAAIFGIAVSILLSLWLVEVLLGLVPPTAKPPQEVVTVSAINAPVE